MRPHTLKGMQKLIIQTAQQSIFVYMGWNEEIYYLCA